MGRFLSGTDGTKVANIQSHFLAAALVLRSEQRAWRLAVFDFIPPYVKYNFCHANALSPIATSLPCIILPRHERFKEAAGDADWSGARAATLCAGSRGRKTIRSGAAAFAGGQGEGNPYTTVLRLRCRRGWRRRHPPRGPRSVLPVAERAPGASGGLK